MAWYEILLVCMVGYAVNGIFLSIFGDESLEGPKWLIALRLSSLVPFATMLLLAGAMCAVIAGLVIMSILYCPVSAVLALWQAWKALREIAPNAEPTT